MEDHPENSLREARQTFRYDASVQVLPGGKPASNQMMRVKTFKSGNSMALRLPAALGLKAGVEMELTLETDGTYLLRPLDAPKRKIDVSKFAGKAPWLKELPRYDFEDSPRDWHLLDGSDAQS